MDIFQAFFERAFENKMQLKIRFILKELRSVRDFNKFVTVMLIMFHNVSGYGILSIA